MLAKIRGLATRAAVTQMKVADLPGSPLSAVLTLAPDAASTTVLGLGTEIDMTGVAIYNLTWPQSFTNASFVAEGEPIKVGQGVFASTPLTMCKIAMIGALSDELHDASDGAASTTIEHTIKVAVGRGLDAVLFSSAAPSAIAPAGLLYGVVPITPIAGGGFNAMSGDLRALISSIAAAGIDTASVVFVCSPSQALALSLAAGPHFAHEIIEASGLAANTVIAIATAGLAASGSGVPEVSTSKFAALHMSDTPVNIGSGAGVAAAPSISTFQSATFALRVIARVCWAAAPGSVSVCTGCTW